MPVPTAVPPCASSERLIDDSLIKLIDLETIDEYPLNSCPSVIGVASCK